MKNKLIDESIMPFGMYSKTKTPMADVPADYLIWLYENELEDGNVKDYIKENMDALKKEINEKR